VLKSKTTWIDGSGSDDYGFNALAAGENLKVFHNDFSDLGKSTSWWTSENMVRTLIGNNFVYGVVDERFQYSVRCVQN